MTLNQEKARRILLAEKSSFSERGMAALQEMGILDAQDLCQADLAHAVKNCQVLMVRLGLRVTEKVLSASRGLLVVGTPTTGLDHIDLEAATRRGVAVISLKGEREFLDQVYATAEHTFALLLSLVRRLPAAFADVCDGGWRRDIFRGKELHGKTLGIIGCGRLGTMTAGYAAAFGMIVLVYDPFQEKIPAGVERVASLDELLKCSDVISLHVSLDEKTSGMFGEEQFRCLKPGAFLINTARGSLLDEEALLAALRSGRLAGAALDVLADESFSPTSSSRKLVSYAASHDNLIVTPHIGGATIESVEKADLFVIEKIRQYLGALNRE